MAVMAGEAVDEAGDVGECGLKLIQSWGTLETMDRVDAHTQHAAALFIPGSGCCWLAFDYSATLVLYCFGTSNRGEIHILTCIHILTSYIYLLLTYTHSLTYIHILTCIAKEGRKYTSCISLTELFFFCSLSLPLSDKPPPSLHSLLLRQT